MTFVFVLLKMMKHKLKFFLGYCSFHHIILKFASEYPIIRETADFWLKEFMSHDSKRVKLVIPGILSTLCWTLSVLDLGELLVLLSICSDTFTWEAISSEFLQEFFDRLGEYYQHWTELITPHSAVDVGCWEQQSRWIGIFRDWWSLPVQTRNYSQGKLIFHPENLLIVERSLIVESDYWWWLFVDWCDCWVTLDKWQMLDLLSDDCLLTDDWLYWVMTDRNSSVHRHRWDCWCSKCSSWEKLANRKERRLHRHWTITHHLMDSLLLAWLSNFR